MCIVPNIYNNMYPNTMLRMPMMSPIFDMSFCCTRLVA